MINADTQHHNLGRNTEETEMATSPSRSPPKAQTDGPEKPLSGIWDLSYRRDLKEKQEDQPRDGKMT